MSSSIPSVCHTALAFVRREASPAVIHPHTSSGYAKFITEGFSKKKEMIAKGDRIADLIGEKDIILARLYSGERKHDLSVKQLFEGRKVLAISFPATDTPVCTMKHIPYYLSNAAKFQELGYTLVLFATAQVNTFNRWLNELKKNEIGDIIKPINKKEKSDLTVLSQALEKIEIAADHECEFAFRSGLRVSHPDLGVIYQRAVFATNEEGIVQFLQVDNDAKLVEETHPDAIFQLLNQPAKL